MQQSEDSPAQVSSKGIVKAREWFYVFILCFGNLVNYMDRMTVAGILYDIQEYYKIGDGKGGLLQSFFMVAYMAFAPLFGYLGDRYNRKYIMVAGIIIWTTATLCGSFMKNFWLFAVSRAVVGIGEASYSTIGPTLIGDYFINHVRTKMLTLYYFAVPVGGGLGYIVGAEAAKVFKGWQWGLRVTPVLSLIAILLIMFFLRVPKRSEREGAERMEHSSLRDDLKMLSHNKSFILTSAGCTSVSFVLGAIAWWGPKFLILGFRINSTSDDDDNKLSTLFGITTILSGVTGLALGYYLSYFLRRKFRKVEPILCGVGMLISAPMVFGVTYSTHNTALCYTLIYFGQLGLLLNMAIVNDILLAVVVPPRTASAQGIQLFVMHAFGDVGSAYITGLLSELFQSILSTRESGDELHFISLRLALFVSCSIELVGAVLFIITAFYLVKDKREVEIFIEKAQQSAS